MLPLATSLAMFGALANAANACTEKSCSGGAFLLAFFRAKDSIGKHHHKAAEPRARQALCTHPKCGAKGGLGGGSGYGGGWAAVHFVAPDVEHEHEDAVEGVFDRDGENAYAEVVGRIVRYYGAAEEAAGEHAVGQDKGDEDEQKAHKEGA